MKQKLGESQKRELQLPELPELAALDVELDDDNSLPELSDKELGGDEVEMDLFVDHPTPTKLEFDVRISKKMCLISLLKRCLLCMACFKRMLQRKHLAAM